MSERRIAIVVAREGSVRFPGKALAQFNGHPLVRWATLRLASVVETIVVGSDSDDILDAAKPVGWDVEYIPLKRNPWCCDESVADARMMIRDVMVTLQGRLDPDDDIMWAHPTNPLVSPTTYGAAFGLYDQWVHQGPYDSLVSVRTHRGHFWSPDWKPLTHYPDRPVHMVASECSPFYEQDGAIFIQRYARWLKTSYFYGSKPFLFRTPADEDADIDTKADLDRALQRYGKS